MSKLWTSSVESIGNPKGRPVGGRRHDMPRRWDELVNVSIGTIAGVGLLAGWLLKLAWSLDLWVSRHTWRRATSTGNGGSDGSKGTRIRDAEEGYDVNTEVMIMFEWGQDGRCGLQVEAPDDGRGGSASEATREKICGPAIHWVILITRHCAGFTRVISDGAMLWLAPVSIGRAHVPSDLSSMICIWAQGCIQNMSRDVSNISKFSAHITMPIWLVYGQILTC